MDTGLHRGALVRSIDRAKEFADDRAITGDGYDCTKSATIAAERVSASVFVGETECAHFTSSGADASLDECKTGSDIEFSNAVK